MIEQGDLSSRMFVNDVKLCSLEKTFLFLLQCPQSKSKYKCFQITLECFELAHPFRERLEKSTSRIFFRNGKPESVNKNKHICGFALSIRFNV